MEDKLTGKNIYKSLAELFKKKEAFILATVTGTYGSTPQKPGSSAIIGRDGLISGTVGGGAVEFSIVTQAREALRNKKSSYYQFDLSNDISEQKGPICGGGMNILLDASPEKHHSVFQALSESQLNRTPGVLITLAQADVSGRYRVERIWATKENFSSHSSALKHEIARTVNEMLNQPSRGDFREIKFPASFQGEKYVAFLETITPPPRLVITGAGHVGKALSHMGKLLDFEVTVWDDRPEFASQANLPDAHHVLNGHLKTLENLNPDKDTYIVIVTRGHQNDSEVLKTFIGSPAGYIGMMGSKRKIVQVKEQFLEEGWATNEQWNKVFTPIGIDIHSKTVQEIAVSIAAQLVLVRNQLNQNHG